MSSRTPDPRPALVIGCGYLGRRVAEAWRDEGRRVVVLTRGRAAGLAAAGFEPVAGDVTDPTSLGSLPEASTVLYAVGFDRAAGKSMREIYVGGLSNVLAALPVPGRFVYASSTGVYGRADGGVVDETSSEEPLEESGRVVRDAERLLSEQLPAAILLRLAGLYGPGRLLREKAIRAGEPFTGDAEKWLNLVHVADAAAAVRAAEDRGHEGERYNVADGSPVRRREFYTHLAGLLGAPPAAFVPGPVGVEPNRRVSVAKARAELGFVPAYPSYREGLAASVPPAVSPA